MQKIRASEVKEFALDYLDSKDINPFMSLFYKCDSETEKIDLIDKLINQKKIFLAEIEQGEKLESGSPDLHVYKAKGRGIMTKYENGTWEEKESEKEFLWVREKNEKFSFVIQEHGNFASLVMAEVNPLLQSKGHFAKLFHSIKYFCFSENKFDFIHARAAIPAGSLFNLNQENKIVLRADSHNDWRKKSHQLRSRKVKLDFVPTKLFHLWVKNKGVYPRTVVDPFASKDEFMIVNDEVMRSLPKSIIREFERAYSKEKNQRYA